MTDKIALLGWGSLLWEGGSAFDQMHEPWQFDGPILKLEFSRISKSRGGALTLVIDPENGTPNRVAWCTGRRNTISETVDDLRMREGTRENKIGRIARGADAHYRDVETYDVVQTWMIEHDLAGVVWTDLDSNFAEKTGSAFSVEAAIQYLCKLDARSKTKALEYINCAPAFVQTPLRVAISKHSDTL